LPSFQVTTPNARVNLRADGTAEVPYSVTNVSGGARRAAFSIKPSDASTKAWYSIRGAPSLEFSPGTTQQVTVVVTPGNGAAPKDYSFQLIAALADTPDVDFTEGPTVTYSVAGPAHTPFPWWIVIAAVALIAILVGVFWYVGAHKKASVATMPDLSGQTLASAQDSFANLTITDGNCPVYGPSNTVGQIATQTVAAGTPITASPQAVSVCVRVQGTQVPQVPPLGNNVNAVITAVGLVPLPPTVSVFCGFGLVYGITSFSPAAGTWVEPGSSVHEIGGCVGHRVYVPKGPNKFPVVKHT
jgi:hypothetical protein